MAETHFIEVVAGRGEPPSLELRPGVELAPLSVGTGGAWQVSAPGVRLVHLYVYFDGQTLFLQSAEADDPPRMNGQPVPGAWTAVSGRCVITFGQAQLVFRPADDATDNSRAPEMHRAPEEHNEHEPEPEDEPTMARALDFQPNFPQQPAPVPQRQAIPARPFKPGAFAAPIDESTRLQPLEDFLGPSSGGDSTRVEPLEAAAGAMPAIRPAAGAPWNRDNTAPAPMGGPGMGPPNMGQGMHPGQMGMPQNMGQGMHPGQMGMPQNMGQGMHPGQMGMPQNMGQGMHPGQMGMPQNMGQGMHPGQMGMPQMPPRDGPPSGLMNIGPPSIRKPEAPEGIGAKMGREWKAAPPIRKALLIAMPFGLGLAFWVIFAGGTPPATQGLKTPASAGSDTLTGAEPPTPSSAPATSAGPSAANPPPGDPAAANPQPQQPGAQPQQPVPQQPVPQQPGVAQPSQPGQPVRPGAVVDGGNINRRERQAADYVSTHNYEQAIRLYEQLASERQQNAAFHEAARILREKLESGKP